MPVHAILSPSLIVPPDELGTGTANNTVFLRGDGVWATPAGGGGTSDHSLLTNLAADDHTQYFNTTRGDARYSQLGHSHTGTVLGTGVTAINSNHTARISGIIRTGATAGNFQVQARSEVAASNITLQIGSRLSLVKLI